MIEAILVDFGILAGIVLLTAAYAAAEGIRQRLRPAKEVSPK